MILNARPSMPCNANFIHYPKPTSSSYRTLTGCFPFLFAVINFISNAKNPFLDGFLSLAFGITIAVLQTGHDFFAFPAQSA